MPYEVLEKQIKALPKEYYDSLVDYLGYLTKKAEEAETNLREGFRYRSSLLTSLRSVAVAAYHPSRNKANLSLDGLLLCHCRA